MAQVDSKQFDALLGISGRMERSLESIEKLLSPVNAGKQAGVSGAVSNLASMALSVNTIIKALSTKDFKKKTADNVLSFVEGMAASTRNLNADNLKSLSLFSIGMSRFIDTMSSLSLIGLGKIALFGKILFSGRKPLLKTIIEGTAKAIRSIPEADVDKLSDAGKAIASLSVGLTHLVKAMATLALIAVAAPLIVIGALTARLVVGLFTTIGQRNKDIELGGKGIRELGRGLVMLSAGLALMALLVTVVRAETYFEAIAVVAGFSFVFAVIGKASDSILRGTRAVTKMGVALAGLSAGIALISLVAMLVPAKVLLMGMLLVAGYGLVFAVIGRASAFIADGALVTILGIAVGLFFFSGALLLMAYTIEKVGIGNAFLGAALLTAFALAFIAIGFKAPLIQRGAVAIGSIGAGLAVFSLGLILYALSLKGVLALFKNDWQIAAAATAGIIFGLGVLFVGMGAVAPLITAGAAALGAIGAGIAVFGVGLILYALALKGVLALFKNDWQVAAKATVGMILGLAGLFSVVGLLVIPIALGAAALGIIGAGLAVFSVGLMLFGLSVKAIKSLGLLRETKGDRYEFIGTDIIVSIMKGFAKAGLYAIPALIGVAGAIAVGVGLLSIGTGLLATSKALEKIPNAADFKAKLFDKETGIITVLFSEFSKIGKQYGFFSMLVGADPASKGARAVKRIGDALGVLAGGIAKFAKVDKFPVQIAGKDGSLRWENVSLDTTLKNLRKVMVGDDGQGGILLTLARVFGEIGNMPEVTGIPNDAFGKPVKGSFFGNLLRRITGDTPMLRGIRAVSKIGGALESLAGGITAFANVNAIPVQIADKDGNLIYRNVKLDEIMTNVEKVMIGDGDGGILLTLAKVFGKIGNMSEITGIPDNKDGSPGQGSFFGNLLRRITGDTPMIRGIKNVARIGDVLSSLAGGITTFANVDSIPVQIASPDGSKLIYRNVSLDEVIENVKTVLIGEGPIGKDNKGLLFALANVLATIATEYPSGLLESNDVKKGANRVKAVSDAIAGISQGVLAFAEIEKTGVPTGFDKDGKPIGFERLKISRIQENMEAIITALPKVFANLDTDILESAEENAEDYEEMAKTIGAIGTSVKSIRDAFMPRADDKNQVGVLTMVGTELETFMAKIAANPVQDSVINSMNKLIDVFGRFGSVASPFRQFVGAFKDFQDPLAMFSTNIKNFATNFQRFSSQLKNYEKFAQLLNSHAQLSKQYTIFVPQFAHMSKDLEIFAKNFKLMDATAIEAFKIWTEALTNFVKTDPKTFETIADQLAKVINVPLTVQDQINRLNKAAEEKEETNAPNLTNEEGRKVMESAVSAKKTDIELLKDQVSQLVTTVNLLLSRLNSSDGINVRVTN